MLPLLTLGNPPVAESFCFPCCSGSSSRYSRATQRDCYKTFELSAEGTLNSNENWQTVQATLYTDLGEQLKVLWSTRSDQLAPTEQRIGYEDSNGTVPENFCSEHQTSFKQYTKGESTWYAHKAGDSWCNEK